MAGHTPWRKIRGELTPERQARVSALKKQFEQEMLLEEVRRALQLTQEDMAKRLHTSQAYISKMEKRTDMLLSTLSNYLHGMGGHLEIRARFPGLGEVQLKGLGELRTSK